MRTRCPSTDDIRTAADAVVEYALIAFRPEYLRWEKALNCSIAEMMWNACGGGEEPLAMGAPGHPQLAALMQVLAAAHRTRWRACGFLVFDLDVHTHGGEPRFTFRLTWDEGKTTHPCEIVVDMPGMPALLN